MLSILEKARYKGLANETRRSAQIGKSVTFTWDLKNDSSLKNLTAIRASLAIWKQEDQRFEELLLAQPENKTNFHSFQNDEHLAHMERITWVGNLTDLLFSFLMTNVSLEDDRQFYLLICCEESREPYKEILVFSSSYLDVQGN